MSLTNLKAAGITDAIYDLIFSWLLPNIGDKLKMVTRNHFHQIQLKKREFPPLVDAEKSINAISTLPASPNDSDWHNDVVSNWNANTDDDYGFWEHLNQLHPMHLAVDDELTTPTLLGRAVATESQWRLHYVGTTYGTFSNYILFCHFYLFSCHIVSFFFHPL